ncbi:MAG TPA: hypothetical protein EYP30_04810 [Archaeoglobaceae archaeon]|nr:hypothetical protein [Archaeoglobaceae archaeon]
MEDKKISDISKLLIRGAKMLSYHCPDCKIPLFQDGERVFCPSCNRDAIIEGKENLESVNIKKDAYINTRESELKESPILDESKNTLRGSQTPLPEAEDMMKRTIVKLSEELNRTGDLNKIREIIETIDRIADVLERLRRLS